MPTYDDDIDAGDLFDSASPDDDGEGDAGNLFDSAKPKVETVNLDDGEGDASDFLAESGFKLNREVPDIEYPWMRYHEFNLVQTLDEVKQVVDDCIKSGHCALDL